MWEMDYEKAASVWLEKDKDSVHMEEDVLKDKIDEFIKAHNTCALAVASGVFVRCTPIEYNYVDGSILKFERRRFNEQ